MWKLLKGGFDAELNFNCLQIKAYKREREKLFICDPKLCKMYADYTKSYYSAKHICGLCSLIHKIARLIIDQFIVAAELVRR